jgi:heat shock protein HtpX
VYLPYLLLSSSDSAGTQSLLLLVFGVAIAGGLLWSLVPRADKFTAPGPLLDRAQHPRLFAELDAIAASLNEPMPSEVYLIGEVNAWVADRGGVLGFGSRRVMGLGLPLLSVLTVSQFRATLAHEFAHYYGGDTSLGPWVYKTKMAMIRTFQAVGSLSKLARFWVLVIMYMVVTTVLKWYFIVFLRAINLISRRQEYRADELACLVAGRQPLIDGLRTIHGAAPAWQPYWNTEVVPVLNCGSLPALGDGFARFVASPTVSQKIADNVKKEILEGKVGPYDTHPPLRERIAAAQALPPGSEPAGSEADARPASTLLDHPESAELGFIHALNPKLQPGSLRFVAWDEVGAQVTVPGWREAAREYGSAFQGVTVENLPDAIPRLQEIGAGIRDPKGMLLTPAQRTQRAGQLLGVSLALALFDNGWELHLDPGVFHFEKGSEQLNPFTTVVQLIEGKLLPNVWTSRSRELGIGQLALFGKDQTAPAVEKA